MRDVLAPLLGWWRAGAPVGLATVVATWHSAPRPPGAAMVVGPAAGVEADPVVLGSVSGGCVEADVVALAESVLAGGLPRLRRYGVSDSDAVAVGLSCGGTLDVFVETVSRETFPGLEAVADAVAADRPVAVATVVEHPDPALLGRRLVVGRSRDDVPPAAAGSLGDDRLDAAVAEDVRAVLATGRSEVLTFGPDGQRPGAGVRVFCSSLAPRPRMVVFGASDFAAAVAGVGSFLGYRVTVCDARSLFATPSRFPAVDELVLDWPHRYLTSEAAAGRVDGTSVLCVLTHDPKFDVPLLEVALRLPVAYVGAMGSRRTHEDRLRRLAAAGLTAVELGRLASPLGLDLGARTPEETAVSIAAEIIRSREGAQGRPLSEGRGRIHPGS